MSAVILCEKPSQARNISQAVGTRYGVVLAAAGHLVRLEAPEEANAAWEAWSPGVLWPGRLYGYRADEAAYKRAKLMQDLGEDTSLHRLSERSVCSQCGCKRMQFRAELRRDEVRPGPPRLPRDRGDGHVRTLHTEFDIYRLTLPAEAPAQVRPSYNVAPTQQLPIVRPHGEVREGVIAGWGLVPFWMKDLKRGAFSTINARCETVRTAPAYREPFKSKRCIVPVSG